jgi:hypothetical protein
MQYPKGSSIQPSRGPLAAQIQHREAQFLAYFARTVTFLTTTFGAVTLLARDGFLCRLISTKSSQDYSWFLCVILVKQEGKIEKRKKKKKKLSRRCCDAGNKWTQSESQEWRQALGLARENVPCYHERRVCAYLRRQVEIHQVAGIYEFETRKKEEKKDTRYPLTQRCAS